MGGVGVGYLIPGPCLMRALLFWSKDLNTRLHPCAIQLRQRLCLLGDTTCSNNYSTEGSTGFRFRVSFWGLKLRHRVVDATKSRLFDEYPTSPHHTTTTNTTTTPTTSTSSS